MTARGVDALAAALLHLLGGQAEDDDVVAAHMLEDLDIGAVQRADGERAVQRELHVAGARGLHARRRDLLGEIGGRNDHLGQADIVVGHEHHLEQAAHGGIVVDHLRPRR